MSLNLFANGTAFLPDLLTRSAPERESESLSRRATWSDGRHNTPVANHADGAEDQPAPARNRVGIVMNCSAWVVQILQRLRGTFTRRWDE
jgi:hypothetical protein